jgi:hypothetical protein
VVFERFAGEFNQTGPAGEFILITQGQKLVTHKNKKTDRLHTKRRNDQFNFNY